MNALMNKKEQTYNIIKNRILTEEYPMGHPLNIKHISEELGISNSPIREALSMLEKEGLVMISANSVPKVVELSKEDMFEISQMVFFLVIGAYRFVVHCNKSTEILALTEELLAKEKAALAQDDYYGFVEHGINFYRCVIGISGNRRLLEEYKHIYPLFYLCGLAMYKEEKNIERIIANHEQFNDYVRTGKYDDAIDVIAQFYYHDTWGGEIGL